MNKKKCENKSKIKAIKCNYIDEWKIKIQKENEIHGKFYARSMIQCVLQHLCERNWEINPTRSKFIFVFLRKLHAIDQYRPKEDTREIQSENHRVKCG